MKISDGGIDSLRLLTHSPHLTPCTLHTLRRCWGHDVCAFVCVCTYVPYANTPSTSRSCLASG